MALCIEAETEDKDLAEKVRLDKSFDVAIPTSPNVNSMQVDLFKFKGEIPLFDTYCGDAITKILRMLPYKHYYVFPATIRLHNIIKNNY